MTICRAVDKLKDRVNREVNIRKLLMKLIQRIADIAVCHALLIGSTHQIRHVTGSNHQLKLVAVNCPGSLYIHTHHIGKGFGDIPFPSIVGPPGFINKQRQSGTITIRGSFLFLLALTVGS